MTKKPKVPAGCVFCGKRPLSDEHFWPQWASDYLPEEPTHSRGLAIGGINAPDELVVRDWKRQGQVGTITLPVVCEECNNEWMNDLEIEIRPILEPILQGSSAVLNNSDQEKLATYIAMKVMVADQSILEKSVFLPYEYQNMFDRREIPSDLSIDIYRYTGPFVHLNYYNREYVIPAEGDRGIVENSMVNFVYAFGPILIRALAIRGSGPSPLPNTPMVIRLHPPTGQSRAWPPIADVSEGDAISLQHTLQLSLSENGSVEDVIRRQAPKFAPYNERR